MYAYRGQISCTIHCRLGGEGHKDFRPFQRIRSYKRLRHYANHGEQGVVDGEFLTDYVRLLAETALAEALTDDSGKSRRITAFGIVRPSQDSADQRPGFQCAKEIS